jgi:uncharacterized protein YjbI with pentapeptide repeats
MAEQCCSYQIRRSEPATWKHKPGDDWLLETDSWECPHEVFDHETIEESEYCIFHLDPAEVSAEINAKKSEQLVDQLNRNPEKTKTNPQPQQFIGAKFESLEIPEGATIESPIRLNYAVIHNRIVAEAVTFERELQMRGVRFGTLRPVVGQHRRFAHIDERRSPLETSIGDDHHDVFEVADTDYYQIVSFCKSRFENGLTLTESSVIGNCHVSFSEATFSGYADVSFANVRFRNHGHIVFNVADFRNEGDVSFAGTQFNNDGDIAFSLADFENEGDLSFERGTVINGSYMWFHDTDFLNPAEVAMTDIELDKIRAIEFNKATFVEDFLFNAEINDVDSISFVGADFSQANLEISFAPEISLKKANLTGVDLKKEVLTGVPLTEANLTRANLFGSQLDISQLVGTILTDTRIDTQTGYSTAGHRVETQTKFAWGDWIGDCELIYEECCGILATLVGSKNERMTSRDDATPMELSSLADSYQKLQFLAESNSRSDLASRSFVRRKDILRRSEANQGRWRAWLRSVVLCLTMRYGESPIRVLGTALLVVLGGSLLYPIGLVERPNGEFLRYTLSWELLPTLGDSVYFSLLTFTTLGYGSFQPRGLGKLVAVGEATLGLVLFAIFVFVVGRRAAK